MGDFATDDDDLSALSRAMICIIHTFMHVTDANPNPNNTHTHTHTHTSVFVSKSDINSFPGFDVDDVVDMRGNDFDVPLSFRLLGVIP